MLVVNATDSDAGFLTSKAKSACAACIFLLVFKIGELINLCARTGSQISITTYPAKANRMHDIKDSRRTEEKQDSKCSHALSKRSVRMWLQDAETLLGR